MKMRCAWLIGALTACLHAAAGAAHAANPTRPGEFVIDPPTLINLGFEWFIDGDDNRNASVAVSYRKAGDSRWLNALPLLFRKDTRKESPDLEMARGNGTVIPNVATELEPGRHLLRMVAVNAAARWEVRGASEHEVEPLPRDRPGLSQRRQSREQVADALGIRPFERSRQLRRRRGFGAG